jgi:hypothetical protein
LIFCSNSGREPALLQQVNLQFCSLAAAGINSLKIFLFIHICIAEILR